MTTKKVSEIVLCNFKEEDSSCVCYDFLLLVWWAFCHWVDIACVLEEDSQETIQMLQVGMLLYLMILKGCVMNEGILFAE